MRKFHFPRALGALTLVTAIGLLAGCSSAPADAGPAETGKKSGKFVIGFEQPLGGQAWREMGLASLQALAHSPKYKDKVEVKIVRTNDNDAAQQNAAMQNLIADGVDILLFDPASSSGADAAIAQAKAKGIPVIANGGPYDNPYVHTVSTDWPAAATTGANWLVKQLGSNKKIAVLEGVAGVPLNEDSMPTAEKIFKDAGVEVVAQGTNGWNESTAQQAMATILRSHSDLGGVFSFLAGGQGVPDAYAAADLPFVPTVGGSGYNGEACTLVKYADKGLTGDMVFGQPSIYAKGLQQAVELLDGKKIKKEQLFPPLEITEKNAKDYCLSDKPSNFQLGYDFPGLDLTIDDVLKYYSGS